MTPNQGLPDFSDVDGGASSTAPKPQAEQAAPRTHTVAKGDSLSKISKQYYGRMDKWRAIYEANRATIGNNPDLIKPGQVLTIPEL